MTPRHDKKVSFENGDNSRHLSGMSEKSVNLIWHPQPPINQPSHDRLNWGRLRKMPLYVKGGARVDLASRHGHLLQSLGIQIIKQRLSVLINLEPPPTKNIFLLVYLLKSPLPLSESGQQMYLKSICQGLDSFPRKLRICVCKQSSS